jgi:hypothetical protein
MNRTNIYLTDEQRGSEVAREWLVDVRRRTGPASRTT